MWGLIQHQLYHSSLWILQCSLPWRKCLPGIRNLPWRLQDVSSNISGLCSTGALSHCLQRVTLAESSRYSGHHCALGGLWGFSESTVAVLSVLVTDREPAHSAHSGALDGTSNRFSSQRKKINLRWFYNIIPFLCLIFPFKCQLPFLEKNKTKKRDVRGDSSL